MKSESCLKTFGTGNQSSLATAMKKTPLLLIPFCLLLSPFFLYACTTDAYEKGTGKYSQMLADMAEVTVNDQKQATSFVTDDGDRYMLIPTVTAQWIQTSDTIYRAIIYYTPKSEKMAEAVALGSVPTLRPREHWRFQNLPQDPIGMESVWVSRSGKYINMGLLVKSGQTEAEDQKHTLGLAQDTIIKYPDQRCTAVYRLLHDQGGVPEYYTDRRYVSILLPDDRPDTVILSVQSYDGLLTKTLVVK